MNIWDLLWTLAPGYIPKRAGQHRLERAKVWAGDLIERLAAERRERARQEWAALRAAAA